MTKDITKDEGEERKGKIYQWSKKKELQLDSETVRVKSALDNAVMRVISNNMYILLSMMWLVGFEFCQEYHRFRLDE